MSNCGHVYYRCKMMEIFKKKILKGREEYQFGELGPCKFMDIDDFFPHAVNLLQENGSPSWLFNHERTIAIGDIHGDIVVLLAALNMTGMIDDDCNWIGGDSLVVLCGDILDRSGRGVDISLPENNHREEVDILQYLYFLNKQAQNKAGGRIIAVLGNHETLRVFRAGSERSNRYAGMQSDGWAGHENMKRVFQPGGMVAQYIALSMPLIVKNTNYLFMHGSIPQSILDDYAIEKDIHTPNDLIGRWNQDIFSAMYFKNGEFPKHIKEIAWSKAFGRPALESYDDKTCSVDMERQSLYLGFDINLGGIVVGHSIQKRIQPSCDFGIWRVDLGMSSAFGGRRPIGALEIIQDPDYTRLKSIMNLPSIQEPVTQTIIKQGSGHKHEDFENLESWDSEEKVDYAKDWQYNQGVNDSKYQNYEEPEHPRYPQYQKGSENAPTFSDIMRMQKTNQRLN
jgi:hypothetical protein